MELDKTGLEDRTFEAFALTSKRKYIYLCNIRTNVSRWSKNAVEYFGLPGEYMLDAGAIWGTYLHPDDREMYFRDLEEVFAGKKDHRLDYRVRNRDGCYVVCSCRGMILRGENGDPDLFAGTIVNHGIMDTIDPITNLCNMYEFLNQVRQTKEMRKKPFILMIGINHFGDVNDVYDYVFGNRVLYEFAGQLKSLVRGMGNVYRLDGSKFGFILKHADEKQVEELYDSIQRIAARNVYVENVQVPLDISGGAVLVKNDGVGESSIRTGASYALAKSKREKHGELVFFDNQYSDQTKRNLELLDVIRQSVVTGCQGFYLCYQPLVRASDGKITGMEALARWNREPYGEVPPGIFIPWLEHDACFFELGNWILKRAMTDGRQFTLKDPGFVINVNVSYEQLDRSGFRDTVTELLSETGFPPQNLCLELTERCRAMDLGRLHDEVSFFRSRGIKVALDDFGTGASSLNLLRELPVDVLKIDRAFISDIETNRTDQAIVETMVQCAGRLGIEVCAEGVEDRKMRDDLMQYGADTHQGYYYSRPVRIEDFSKLMEKKPASISSFGEFWQWLIAMQGRTFYTVRRLPFTFTVKGGELFVDRRKKSITKATCEKAYQNAVTKREELHGPKALNVFGAPYLWALFQEAKIL